MTAHPPLPVVDLVAFGLLAGGLVSVHAVRMRIREDPALTSPEGSEATTARLARLDLSTRAFQAGAWLCTFYGLSIAARVVGFV